jgi:hypothetical protein
MHYTMSFRTQIHSFSFNSFVHSDEMACKRHIKLFFIGLTALRHGGLGATYQIQEHTESTGKSKFMFHAKRVLNVPESKGFFSGPA